MKVYNTKDLLDAQKEMDSIGGNFGGFDFVDKDDHDNLIAERDLEIKMLRDQRDRWVVHHLEQASRARVIDGYENEIKAAKAALNPLTNKE